MDAAAALLAPSLYPVVFPFGQLMPVVVPFAMAVAVLRHQLFDVEAVVSRALVYVILTFLLVTGYALAATWASSAIPGSAGGLARVLAPAVVAVAFAPLRDGLHRIIGRRLYGDRGRPYDAMTRLARQLQQPSAPEQVLTTLVVLPPARSGPPYAAIELDNEGEPAAEHGTRPVGDRRVASVELTHAGVRWGSSWSPGEDEKRWSRPSGNVGDPLHDAPMACMWTPNGLGWDDVPAPQTLTTSMGLPPSLWAGWNRAWGHAGRTWVFRSDVSRAQT